MGRLMGQGREREGKGKEKEITFNFCSFGSFRNGFEIPKQTERGDYILSEKIPKQNRNCQCFGLFQFEPKETKSVSQDTLVLSKMYSSVGVLNLCPILAVIF